MRRACLGLFVCLLPIATLEVAAEFVPAQLGSGPDSIHGRFRAPPDLADGIYSLRCEAVVGSTGKARQFACLSGRGTNPRSLIRAVTRAGKAARFEPAREHGKPVAIFMAVTMLLRMQDGVPVVGFFPNDAEHWATFGLDYVSPQRVNQFGDMVGNSGVQPLSGSIVMKLFVERDGTVSDYALEHDNGPMVDRYRARARRAISRMEFRPGFVNGRPHAMHYVEIYWIP